MKSTLGYSGILGLALGAVAAVAGFNLSFIAAHGIAVVIAYFVGLIAAMVARVPMYKVVMFMVFFTGSAGATSLYLLNNVHH